MKNGMAMPEMDVRGARGARSGNGAALGNASVAADRLRDRPLRWSAPTLSR